MLKDNRIYFGKNKDSKPQIKQFLSEVQMYCYKNFLEI